MNLLELKKKRKALLLKKSEGKATEKELKQLVEVMELISKEEPSIESEIEKLKEQREEKDLYFSKKH